MKTHPAVAFILAGLFCLSGCSSGPTPTPPARPFVGIISVDKVGKSSRETSKYDVALYYDHVEPEKYEIKVGLGYNLSEGARKAIGDPSEGIYAIAHSEVVHNSSGDIHVTIDSSAIRNLKTTMDGKIYAILSKYPHGKEWVVISHSVFVLPPE